MGTAMSLLYPPSAEWLEADGLGGFASGTVAGPRTRRYHALLLTATTPPTGRYVLVNGFDAWVETPAGAFALTSQHYPPDVIHPDGSRRIDSFLPDPWPSWVFRLEDGTHLEQQLLVPHGSSAAIVSWRLLERRAGARLIVRPFFSGRDYHALHHENPGFRWEPDRSNPLLWRPYPGLPGIIALTNGEYRHEPVWFRNFLYTEERARGLDDTEDLASPGTFRWDLSAGEVLWVVAAEHAQAGFRSPEVSLSRYVERVRSEERQRRGRFPSRLHRAADAYIVRRGSHKTILAGYPWFTDWGRDTFIALRGLCLATGRFDDAQEILLDWANVVSQGMLPNLFPDRGDAPEFNSVDASLWYIVAVDDFLQAMRKRGRPVDTKTEERLQHAVQAILNGYCGGTRYHIDADSDGLVAAGVPGVQLTWMDAKVGDWVVTPRIGKPVEIQALWLNALGIASRFSTKWTSLLQRGRRSFRERFWNETGGYLHDVVDVDHQPGTADATFRPNQIFAVGGLPLGLLEGEQARRVVDAVEARLWTPLGLRSLAPGSPGYAGHYQGGVLQRDGSYHQGTVWPWLMGAFVEAWVRVRGSTTEAKRAAGTRFLEPFLRHLDEAGLGHIAEIADGDPPYTPRGCPFQAWSVGEVLRLAYAVLAEKE
jgi:predicted glycogen debranching enzyme